MLTGLKILAAAAVGVVLGLAVTDAAVQRGVSFSLLRVGPWVAAPNAGSGEADPYEKADLARRSEIPLGLGEGLSFVAASDSSGAPLRARCDYVVAGLAPAARYWTLSAMTPQGRLIANAAQRYGFTSAELVRDASGDFAIEVSRFARPGNWLPLGGRVSAFVLDLRLYDTPVTASADTLRPQDMPSIMRKGCA